jgi:hypothetical protein
MKQLFAVVFLVMIGGGLFYWYQTEGKDVISDGDITTALPAQYMKALREEPQSLEDIAELTSTSEDRVQESLDYMMSQGRVGQNDSGLYYAK